LRARVADVLIFTVLLAFALTAYMLLTPEIGPRSAGILSASGFGALSGIIARWRWLRRHHR